MDYKLWPYVKNKCDIYGEAIYGNSDREKVTNFDRGKDVT